MRASKRPRRGVYLLPTLFTTGNLAMGCLGIVLLLDRGERAALVCAIAVFASAVFDMFDGMVARATGTSSKFGMEYDSLADLIAFGAAPAFLAYEFCLKALGPVGVAATVWFVTCAAIRLARFNSAEENRYAGFSGLPSPAAALTVASLVILVASASRYPLASDLLPRGWWANGATAPAVSVLMALLGWLMISRTPYLSFKGVDTSRPRPLRVVLAVVVFLFIAWSIPGLLFGLFLCYVFLGLIMRFLTSVRWAEVVAPALVAWAGSMSGSRRPANGKERNNENR